MEHTVFEARKGNEGLVVFLLVGASLLLFANLYMMTVFPLWSPPWWRHLVGMVVVPSLGLYAARGLCK